MKYLDFSKKQVQTYNDPLEMMPSRVKVLKKAKKCDKICFKMQMIHAIVLGEMCQLFKSNLITTYIYIFASLTVQQTESKTMELTDSWFPKQFRAFQKTFFDVRVKRNNFIYNWVYVLALPDEAKNYFYHASLENGSGEKILTFYGQARSMIENYEDIIANEDCFVFGVTTAKKYADKHTNQLQYRLF